MSIYFYNQNVPGFTQHGGASAGVAPGSFSGGTFTAAASHETLSNGTTDAYYVQIDGVDSFSDLIVGFNYPGKLAFGPNTTGQGNANTTFTVLGVNSSGVIVQASSQGAANGGWQFQTFLLGSSDPSNGQTLPDFVSTTGAPTCFAHGTLIATVAGSIPVESLKAGDIVATASGETTAVTWIGHRRFSLATRPDVAPIRITAGALAAGVPSRDLLISPEHAMGLDGKLVPARLLVNGSTIIRDTSMAEITYFHVELPRHDLLLAEGAAAESWLDTGNRGMFANAVGPVDLHGDFTPDLASEAWRTRACAPLVEGGVALAMIRARIEGRAVASGAGAGTTQTLWLETVGIHSVTLPAGSTGLVRLASVAARATGDHRRLGAGITTVALNGDPLPLDDGRLALGFHGIEACGRLRWTDGQALLDLGRSDDDRLVTIDVNVVAADQDWAIAA
jgi:Hint domain